MCLALPPCLKINTVCDGRQVMKAGTWQEENAAEKEKTQRAQMAGMGQAEAEVGGGGLGGWGG